MDMDNGDYSYQLLTLLSSSIRLNSPDSCTLSISIIDCLAKTIVGLVSDRSFFEGLFWSAVAILQVGQARISMSTIRLLTAVVKALESLNDGGDLEEELLQFRKMETDSSPKLDESSGVSFNHFPFAITRLCQSVPLDDSVEELLYALARWSRSTAFFLTLLPSATKNGKLDRLLETVGIVPQASSEVIVESFLRKARGDKESIILTTALLTRSVSTVGEDEGLLLLYEPLSALLSEYPDVAAKLYVPSLFEIYLADGSVQPSAALVSRSRRSVVANHVVLSLRRRRPTLFANPACAKRLLRYFHHPLSARFPRTPLYSRPLVAGSRGHSVDANARRHRQQAHNASVAVVSVFFLYS